MLDQDRFFENADDDPISGGNASCGLIFDKYREFSALARRLEADDKSLGMEMHSRGFEALWERRSQLARELVDTPAPAIADVVFKMTIVSSLVDEGEVRLGLTPQCVEECERALAVETGSEQCFMALEPALWSSCQQIRHTLAAAAAEKRNYRIQAASPGLAMLSAIDGGSDDRPVEVAIGTDLPGYGKVRSIEQHGQAWVVKTDRGEIE
jgi:hypothetical protein